MGHLALPFDRLGLCGAKTIKGLYGKVRSGNGVGDKTRVSARHCEQKIGSGELR